MKADEERIPEAMAFWRRIVSQMPLEHLFDAAGKTEHVRGGFLAPAAVESMLAASREWRLVEAKMGEPLHWHARGDYDFWYREARPRIPQPDEGMSLDDFPDARCYLVSEWLESTGGDRVLLFEEHH